MKKLLLASIAMGSIVAAAAPALAADGCGPGGHRGYFGHCRPNDRGVREVVVAPGGLVVGNYYHDHGYWDGHRYWQHRYRDRDNWRYR